MKKYNQIPKPFTPYVIQDLVLYKLNGLFYSETKEGTFGIAGGTMLQILGGNIWTKIKRNLYQDEIE